MDCKLFWAAGGVLREGGNPYNQELVTEFAAKNGAGQTRPLPFYYPFYSFSILVPFSLLSFEAVRIGYLSLLALFYLGAWVVPSILNVVRDIDRPDTQWIRPLNPFIYLTFFPVLLLWWNGGLSILPLIALTLYFYLEERINRKSSVSLEIAQGFSIALAATKPSLCYLVIGFLSILWLRTRQWGKLLGIVLGLSALVIPALILWPPNETLLPTSQEPYLLLWHTPTLSTFLQMLFNLPLESRFFLVPLGLIYTIVKALRVPPGQDTRKIVCGVFIPLSLITLPYAWTYDFVALVYPISFLIGDFLHNTSDTALGNRALSIASTTVIISNILLILLPMNMFFHWWYPLAILLICLWKLSRTHEQEHLNTRNYALSGEAFDAK